MGTVLEKKNIPWFAEIKKCSLDMDADVCVQASGTYALTCSLISKLQFLRNLKTFDGGGAYN